MILLPLAPDELALVRKAMRALVVFGDERDIRMNVEESMRRCHIYDNTPTVFKIAYGID